MKQLTFKQYQDLAATTAIFLDGFKSDLSEIQDLDVRKRVETALSISYVGLGLGEAGELQNKIKKIIRDQRGVITDEARKSISKEYGDLLWYIAVGCKVFDIDMEKVADDNLVKLFSRKLRGKLKGSGDER